MLRKNEGENMINYENKSETSGSGYKDRNK